jgi:hypothetical protein
VRYLHGVLVRTEEPSTDEGVDGSSTGLSVRTV